MVAEARLTELSRRSADFRRLSRHKDAVWQVDRSALIILAIAVVSSQPSTQSSYCSQRSSIYPVLIIDGSIDNRKRRSLLSTWQLQKKGCRYKSITLSDGSPMSLPTNCIQQRMDEPFIVENESENHTTAALVEELGSFAFGL